MSYSLRGPGSGDVVVVDETARLVCVAGDVFGFDQVKSLSARSSDDGKVHQLEFVLRSGANPVHAVNLGSDAGLRVAFARLGNTLDLR